MKMDVRRDSEAVFVLAAPERVKLVAQLSLVDDHDEIE
jgi:hypothetical protein